MKPDEYLRVFALKSDYDFTFLQALIEEKKFELAYNFIHFQKAKNLIEYFLRFRDLNFLDKNSKEIFQKLKDEILVLNTYQQILKQELSLPASQRIKEKYKIASKLCNEKSKLVNEYLENISKEFNFLQPLIKGKNFKDLLSNDSKVFVEFYTNEENLFYFIIGSGGTFAKSLQTDLVSLNFNANVLLKNFNQFSINEIVDFTRDNLSWLIDDLLLEIEQRYPLAREITFLINGSELDFLSHIIFSKRLNGFLNDKYLVSYSYLINPESAEGAIKNFAVLNEGQFSDFERVRNTIDNNLPSQEKTAFGRPKVRVGLRETTEPETVEKTIVKKDIDGILILDELVLNETSPEFIYFQSLRDKSNPSSKIEKRFYLKEVFQLNPRFILIKNFELENKLTYLKFLSLFEFISPNRLIFPVRGKGQELSENFLYNYTQRVENKNSREASLIFLKMIAEIQKENLKSSLTWISFTN